MGGGVHIESKRLKVKFDPAEADETKKRILVYSTHHRQQHNGVGFEPTISGLLVWNLDVLSAMVPPTAQTHASRANY